MTYRDRPRTRDERVGESFRADDTFERLLSMPEERRESILQSSPGMRVSFGYYVSARSAALRLEKERTS